MRMKKFLTYLLTLAMVVSLLPQTAFAANNTATTMRLAKTQGTVAVTNATGKKVKQTSNMKLYNGYKLKTGAKSYAWISLDNTKVAKLDANSVVSVQKTGQKLTLYLSSGNLFFNVKETLKSGEAFHIKTSTMTTGIRGTSGCVRVINPRVSEIHLLTGRIEVFAEHPELHLTKSEVLAAGNMATSLIDQEAMQLTGEQVEIIVEELQEHNVCGNCATEVAADPALQERIETETDLDVEEIVNDAEEKLEEDELAAEEEQAAIEEAEAEQDLPEDVDPYFQEEASSGGGGGGGSSAVAPSNVITVTNWQEFVAALTEFNDGTEDTEIRLAADIEPDAGVTTMPAVEDNGASLTLNLQEYGLSIPQPLVNNSNLTITNMDGYITAYDFENWTTSGYIIQNYGTLTHLAGQIQIPGGGNGIENMGTYTLNGGSLIAGNGRPISAIQNRGIFQMMKGTVECTLLNDDNTATISGGTISSDIANASTMTISGGTFTSESTEAMITNEPGAELTISGGTFNSKGTLVTNKAATLSMTGGTITVDTDGAIGIDNSGTAELTGGTIVVRDSATNAIGVSTSGELKTDGTVSISASGNNTGIYVSSGRLELADGRIRANGEAIAVVLRESGAAIVPNVIRPIGASITWGGSASSRTIYEGGQVVESYETINFSGDGEDHLMQPMITMMDTLDPGAEKNEMKSIDPETGREEVIVDYIYEVYFRDMYGKEGSVSGPVTDAREILYAIEQFNKGASNSTLTLGNDIAITLADIETYGDARIENTAATLTIDLAGNTLTLQNQLYVADRASLKITDSGSGGMVTGAIDPLISGEGTFELEDGTLETTGANAVKSVGDVIISGGVINVTQPNATGVSIGSGGSLKMTAGAINQTTTATYSKAIVLSNGSKAEVTGGSINQDAGDSTGIMMGEEGGTAPELTFGGSARINVSDQGNGIVNNYGAVEMTGGTIQLNNVPSKGISSEDGTIEMTGGEIILVGSSNSYVNYGIYGNNTKIVLDGGTVRESGNTTDSLNCAVYAGGGKLDVTSGAVSVNYGQAVYVSSTDIMTLGNVKVTGLDFDDLLVTGDNDETGYTYDGPDGSGYYTLVAEEVVTDYVYEVATAEDIVTAFADTATKAGPFTITLMNDISMEDVTNALGEVILEYDALSVADEKEVTLDLDGNTLSLKKTLTNGGNLTIGGNGTITNISGETVTSLVQNNTNGTLTIDGATITNGTDSACTAVATKGEMTLKSGTIIATAADSYSVEVTNNTFTMEGGTINAAGDGNSAVCVDSAEFVMEDGTIHVTGTGASGVLTGIGSNMTISGGEIIVAADTNGYGIQQLSNSDNLTMTNGTITVNDGYGVFTYGNADITGGSIVVASGAVGVHNNGNGAVTVADTVLSGEGTLSYGDVTIDTGA
ncbi:FecR domain-containing protein [Anaerotignum sp.]